MRLTRCVLRYRGSLKDANKPAGAHNNPRFREAKTLSCFDILRQGVQRNKNNCRFRKVEKLFRGAVSSPVDFCNGPYPLLWVREYNNHLMVKNNPTYFCGAV